MYLHKVSWQEKMHMKQTFKIILVDMEKNQLTGEKSSFILLVFISNTTKGGVFSR